MTDNTTLPPKERFLKIYANLPTNVREEIIYTTDDIDKKTYSWNAANLEVIQDTALSKQILAFLETIGVI